MGTNLKAGRRAFTLVELLVVIAILGILAALVMTASSRGTRLARRTVCANNIRQLGHAMLQFVGDHHMYPPGVTPEEHWTARLEQQLGNSPSPNEIDFLFRGVWKCPAMVRPATYTNLGYVSYGYNVYGMFGGDKSNDTNSLGLGYKRGLSPGMTIAGLRPVGESDVAHPSDMMALGDGFWGSGKALYGGGYDFTRTPDPLIFPLNPEPFVRHKGKANVAFCDGHVETPTLQSMFEDTSDAALSRWNRDHLPHREKL
jgi:prepilin-type processing-associated H-X9-DG protein/prepilin-type N-terminal cleavage/methylation domain-containing protein